MFVYLTVCVVQGLPRVTQFLEQILSALPEWQRSLNPFPAVSWPGFIHYVHDVVNPLAGEEHLKEVIQQLQLMGEVRNYLEQITILQCSDIPTSNIGNITTNSNTTTWNKLQYYNIPIFRYSNFQYSL